MYILKFRATSQRSIQRDTDQGKKLMTQTTIWRLPQGKKGRRREERIQRG